MALLGMRLTTEQRIIGLLQEYSVERDHKTFIPTYENEMCNRRAEDFGEVTSRSFKRRGHEKTREVRTKCDHQTPQSQLLRDCAGRSDRANDPAPTFGRSCLHHL